MRSTSTATGSSRWTFPAPVEFASRPVGCTSSASCNGVEFLRAQDKARALGGRVARLVLGSDVAGERPWAGMVSDLRIWSTARTGAEIAKTMHRRLTAKEIGLAGYWPLDEEQGALVHDRSGKQRHARLGEVARKREIVPITYVVQPARGTGLGVYAYWWNWMSHVASEPYPDAYYRRGHIWS